MLLCLYILIDIDFFVSFERTFDCGHAPSLYAPLGGDNRGGTPFGISLNLFVIGLRVGVVVMIPF